MFAVRATYGGARSRVSSLPAAEISLMTKPQFSYFVHDDGYAGVSAFSSSPAPEQVRNASLLALGVLVPLGLGRLGKCWRHAETLKKFARFVNWNCVRSVSLTIMTKNFEQSELCLETGKIRMRAKRS